MHDFKRGDKVKIYNGGKLEGEATIIKRLPSDNNYYAVLFLGDSPGDLYKRWVFPHWQVSDFDPVGPDADAISTMTCGTPRKARP